MGYTQPRLFIPLKAVSKSSGTSSDLVCSLGLSGEHVVERFFAGFVFDAEEGDERHHEQRYEGRDVGRVDPFAVVDEEVVE